MKERPWSRVYPAAQNLGGQRIYGNSLQFLGCGVQSIAKNIMEFANRVTLSLSFFLNEMGIIVVIALGFCKD